MEKRKISAKIIADSINPSGVRITSYVLTFPRIVLAEFNTHRAFSRNSASSRAIPSEKMLEMVRMDPFVPERWMKDHTGMQGTEYFTEERDINKLKFDWVLARDYAVQSSVRLGNSNLTKQLTNRLLEPFMWHTVIMTATDFENFFALRAEAGAEIHIQELAYLMLEEYNKSEPKELKVGEWHIPFGDNMDTTKILGYFDSIGKSHTTNDDYLEAQIKIATARCARVSYMNFDGKDDYGADIKLYERLSTSGHWSPFEHCARAVKHDGYIGNFRGWKQLRKQFNKENKSDERVKK